MKAAQGWNHFSRTLWIVTGCLLVVVAAGCSDAQFSTTNTGSSSGDLPAELQSPTDGLEILPWVDFQELPANLLGNVEIDESSQEMVVTGPAAGFAEKLEMGDVFFNTAQEGFAVQVTEVEVGAESVKLSYRALALTNLIHGEWEEGLSLDGVGYEDADISTLHQGLFSKDWDFSFGNPGDYFTADAWAAVQVEPELQFDGRAKLGALGFDIVDKEFGSGSCANALLDHDRWGTKAEICADYLRVALGVQLSAEAHARLEAEFSGGKDFDRVLLDRQYEEVSLVGPLYLTAGVKVVARADANGHAEGYLDAKADASVYAPLGFEWHHADGFKAVLPIRDGDRDFNFETDAFAHVDLNASFTLEAELHLSLSVKGMESFAGFGGVGAGAKLHAEAQYLPFAELPCLTAGVTFDSNFNGKLTAWVDASRLRLGEHDWELVDVNHTFPTIDLFSWDDAGRFCIGGDQRVAAELTRTYSGDCEDPTQNPFYGSCTDTLLHQCFRPADGCQGYVDGDRNILMVWPGGERVEIGREVADSVTLDTSHYYGVSGDLCGSSERYVDSGAASGQCAAEEFFVLEQDQTTGDPHLTEAEIAEMYATGQLLRAGAEASSCTVEEPTGVSMNLACPNRANDSSVSVSSTAPQACAVGIGSCSFQAVDEMPMASLSGAW